MELGPGREGGDAHLAVRTGERLEQIEGPVHRLDGPPGAPRLRDFFHDSELSI
jgi:hypothetical protein